MISVIWQWLNENWEGVIALCALLITFLQALSIRKHNRISVKPFLSSSNKYHLEDGVFNFKFIVDNDGLGPAKIEKFSIYFDNEILIANNAMENQSQVTNIIFKQYPKNLLRHNVGALNKGAIISANNDLLLLDLAFKFSGSLEKWDLIKFLDRFDVIIEYESFYGEKDKLDTTHPKPLKKAA